MYILKNANKRKNIGVTIRNFDGKFVTITEKNITDELVELAIQQGQVSAFVRIGDEKKKELKPLSEEFTSILSEAGIDEQPLTKAIEETPKKSYQAKKKKK